MTKSKLLSGIVAMAMAASTMIANSTRADSPPALNFKMKNITGQDVDLAQYKGKVLLVVNVASRCGATPQYKDLEALHEQYGKDGLSVVGFPCNQFGKQEPGTESQIVEFCKSKYDVQFDLFSKVDVNGDEACPLYKYLTSVDAKPAGTGPIKWNFEKFVIGRDGKVVARFPTKVKPNDPEVLKAIEAELAKK